MMFLCCLEEHRLQNGANKVRLMFTHTQANPPIHMWIRQSKKLLSRNDKAKDIGARIQVGSRQPKNLKSIIGGCKGDDRGDRITPPDAGCWKCGRCKVACPVLKEGNKFKSNILKYKKDYTGHHPTQKPILLLEDLIKTFSNEGDLVVDLTMGSGSTGVACKNTNRSFTGIEMDDNYFEIAQDRINNLK